MDYTKYTIQSVTIKKHRNDRHVHSFVLSLSMIVGWVIVTW